jgi:hypothetical protein
MRILDDFPFEIDDDEVFSRLHLDPNRPYAKEIRALIDRARPLARPRAGFEVAFVEEKGDDSVVIAAGSEPGSACRGGRARFVSKVLRANLDEVGRVFPFVATCGPELDTVPVADSDVFGQFCRDTIKEMALYAAIAHLGSYLKETFELEKLVSMSPGSGDVQVWPIEQQKELFAFFGDVQASIGVLLTDSCLMVPNKSVSGLLYASEHDFASCQLCHREKCPGRRAPFDPHLWEERLGSRS